jgi:sugar phosphate isomerase/epimerase
VIGMTNQHKSHVAEMSRRALLRSAAAVSAFGGRLAAGAARNLSIGVTDWNLKLGANPDALPLAARLGFEGVQISFGRRIVEDKMPVDNPEVVSRYLRLASESKIPINATCVDRLHDNGLKRDPLAVKWVRDSIRLTRALNTKILLLPFFGTWAIQNQDEGNYAADALRDLAPEAEKAGVVLGLENTISAEDNVRIMERSRAKNVLVYYDVGNSAQNGFDVVKEILWLGKERICQFHFKDNPHYLGDGSVPFQRIIEAIRTIGFSGFANLETDTLPNSTVEVDMGRNLTYIRRLIGS